MCLGPPGVSARSGDGGKRFAGRSAWQHGGGGAYFCVLTYLDSRPVTGPKRPLKSPDGCCRKRTVAAQPPK